VLIPTPSVGDVVTFSYESQARRDVPVNPRIYRVRYGKRGKRGRGKEGEEMDEGVSFKNEREFAPISKDRRFIFSADLSVFILILLFVIVF
jgi:hypothetical protein